MGLRDTLEKHNIPIPVDFDERLDIIVAGLKRKSSYKQKLEKFNLEIGCLRLYLLIYKSR